MVSQKESVFNFYKSDRDEKIRIRFSFSCWLLWCFSPDQIFHPSITVTKRRGPCFLSFKSTVYFRIRMWLYSLHTLLKYHLFSANPPFSLYTLKILNPRCLCAYVQALLSLILRIMINKAGFVDNIVNFVNFFCSSAGFDLSSWQFEPMLYLCWKEKVEYAGNLKKPPNQNKTRHK